MDKLPLGCSRLYNREFLKRGIDDVILWDVFPVVDGELIQITFESVKSELRQGIWMRTDKGLDINNQHCPSVDLWYDTAPKKVRCKCYTSTGCLSVYNIWESGQRLSQCASSGMRIEELANGRRYHCNDFGFETNFDKLVFRIERIDR